MTALPFAFDGAMRPPPLFLANARKTCWKKHWQPSHRRKIWRSLVLLHSASLPIVCDCSIAHVHVHGVCPFQLSMVSIVNIRPFIIFHSLIWQIDATVKRKRRDRWSEVCAEVCCVWLCRWMWYPRSRGTISHRCLQSARVTLLQHLQHLQQSLDSAVNLGAKKFLFYTQFCSELSL